MLRNRACAYLKEAVDEIRACGRYAFRKNTERGRCYVSYSTGNVTDHPGARTTKTMRWLRWETTLQKPCEGERPWGVRLEAVGELAGAVSVWLQGQGAWAVTHGSLPPTHVS